jgi:superfamily I DNA/RNA helicase
LTGKEIFKKFRVRLRARIARLSKVGDFGQPDCHRPVMAGMRTCGLTTQAATFNALASAIRQSESPPFDLAVVDVAQDITVAELRFLAALRNNRPNALFFAGDLGQRILQQPFSWKSLGVDIRGRSRTLRVNYRTSHQIRTPADRLLGPEMTDVDGSAEKRSDTVSVFNGPPPVIQVFRSQPQEIKTVADWIASQVKSGVLPHEIGLFVRYPARLDRATEAAIHAALTYKILDHHLEIAGGHMAIFRMHLAKGLEFRSVAMMACDDEVIPLQERIQSFGDDADLQEIYDTERQLLYVACTRARDLLVVTAVAPASEFLDDLQNQE